MSWSPIGIGGDRASAYRSDYPSARRTVVPNRLIDDVNVHVGRSSGRLSLDEAREQIRAAMDDFRAAFGAFTGGTKAVKSTSISVNASSSAMLGGLAARVNQLSGAAYSVLQTTSGINTQTSTDRSSSAAIGLDITSAEAASTLRSSAALGLDLTSRQSTIASTGEMDSAATEYGSSTLTFANGTSVGTLSGTYTGVNSAANATSLEIDIKRDSTFTLFLPTRVQFQVKDQTGATLFSFNGDIAAGQSVYLGADIGLSISFSNGTLKNNDTASTTVTHNPAVDTNATFNNANPNLRPRFDGGAQVTGGSFQVNGTTIAVNANDSINSVLSRINSSGAGVTASVSGDRITLASNSASESNIVLSNDTSGFLAATKLSGATTTRGNIADDQQALSATTWFGGVASGSFTVNGKTISINKDTDSLSSVISTINSSGAGVTASYDLAQDKVVLTTTSNSEDLISVDGDTTGFLAAAGLSTGNTVRGNIRDDQQVLSKTTQFASVATGSFSINGVSISVDKDTDSLSSIVSRINGAGAGVTASYDSSTDKLTFTPDVAGATLAIENDTSGFLSAATVASGVTGTDFDADAAFNGTGLNTALFEPGKSVQAGSFTVNGTTINVAANDSVNTVLAKITASAAGVTATYDDATETVRLSRTAASADPITVGNDTSGFLAAVKLDTAQTTVSSTGSSSTSPFDATLSSMAEYWGVSSGTITLNGQQIGVDPTTTTIRGLVTSLNSVPGLAASLDDGTGAIRVSSTTGDAMTISDTSGLLSKLGIAAGTYNGSVGDTTLTETTRRAATAGNTAEVVKNVAAAVDKLNETLSKLGAGNDVSAFRDEIIATLEDAVDVFGQAGVQGFVVNTGDSTDVKLSVDGDALARALNKIGEQATARTTIGDAVDGFAASLDKIGATPGSDSSMNGRPLFASGNPAWARLTADQAATALLYLRSSLQPLKADASAAKAAEAYKTTKETFDRSDGINRFDLTDQIQDHLAAAQVPLSMTPAPPPPAPPSKPAVTKAARVDGGSRSRAERDRRTSLPGRLDETTRKRDPRDEDTFEYRGSDRHVRGAGIRRGARRGLRDTLRTIAGRQR
jgi:hypothetical protein